MTRLPFLIACHDDLITPDSQKALVIPYGIWSDPARLKEADTFVTTCRIVENPLKEADNPAIHTANVLIRDFKNPDTASAVILLLFCLWLFTQLLLALRELLLPGAPLRRERGQ
ncbi:hypothetical protein CC2G_003000 [Coprinopsis cinerea AmutBmut pab1-1]|nr:hypothetical protein CC2G_003000 [Coprinopsis cinerea AmutBmut pab1-1]